jgi:hypothetical protein
MTRRMATSSIESRIPWSVHVQRRDVETPRRTFYRRPEDQEIWKKSPPMRSV